MNPHDPQIIRLSRKSRLPALIGNALVLLLCAAVFSPWIVGAVEGR